MVKKIILFLMFVTLLGLPAPVSAQEAYEDHGLQFETDRLEEENDQEQQKSDLAKDLFSSQGQKKLAQQQEQLQMSIVQRGATLFTNRGASLAQEDVTELFQERPPVNRAPNLTHNRTTIQSVSSAVYVVCVLCALGGAAYVSYRMYL